MKQGVDFMQRVGRANELRIFRNYSRRIINFIKLQRYSEASLDSARLSGILRAWDFRHQMDIAACLKKGPSKINQKILA